MLKKLNKPINTGPGPGPGPGPYNYIFILYIYIIYCTDTGPNI
jgi:hypothetical protein